MKTFVSGVLLFLLALAWVPASFADQNSDYQAALENYQKGQYSKAVIGFQNILVNDPNSWKAYQGLGDAFLAQGDKDGALQAYQRSLQLHPNNPTVKAKADKLFAELPPPPLATPTPASEPTSGDAGNAFKIRTIGTFSDPNGHKHSSNFIFQGKPLQNDQQIEDVIDLLKDDQATRLIRKARSQQAAANVLDVLGGLSIAGALIYGVAAPNAAVTSAFGGFVSHVNPDLTPSYILGGIGAGILLIGLPVEDGANQDRYKAVARYNELARPGSNPQATGKGTEEVAPVTGEATTETSQTAPPPGTPSSPSADSGVSQTGFGISPLVNFPLSGKTGSEYTPGFGFSLDFKQPLDSHWSVGLAATYQDLPVNKVFLAQTFQQTYGVALPSGVAFSGDWYYFPVVALIQYSFSSEKDKVVPYVFGGAGVAFNSATVSATYNSQTVTASTTENDFLVCPGAGLKARLDEKVDVFLQVRLDINFTSQNNSDVITLDAPGGTAKGNGNLSDDSPTLFLPIQMGLDF